MKMMVYLKIRKSQKYHENDFHGLMKQSELLINAVSFMRNQNLHSRESQF